MVAKVCGSSGQPNTTKLEDEIRIADELKRIKEEIQKRIDHEGNLEQRRRLEKQFSGFLKYMTIPKIIKDESRNEGFAIFEAELSDSDTFKAFARNYRKKRLDDILPFKVDYDELRRVAKDILKALQNLHSEGKRHRDIAPWGSAKSR